MRTLRVAAMAALLAVVSTFGAGTANAEGQTLAANPKASGWNWVSGGWNW